MSAWTDARLAAFAAMIAQWGIGIAYKGNAVTGISTSFEYTLEEQRTSMLPKKPSVFSIYRTDYLAWRAMGLKPREVITSENESFQIYAVIDDPADASVDLRCTLKV